MATKAKVQLTGKQKKALRKAQSLMDRAYKKARATLAAANVRPDEGGTPCLVPPRSHCRTFKQPAGGGIRCARPGCGHSFFRHDVF